MHDKTAGKCSRCKDGFRLSESDNVCFVCNYTQWSNDGLSCYELTRCDDKVPKKTGPVCSQCEQGYGLVIAYDEESVIIEATCRECEQDEYSNDGITCKSLSYCADGVTGKTDAVCSQCKQGHKLNDQRQCVECPGTTFGPNGLNCTAIDHCAEGTSGQSTASCTRCEKGHGLTDNGLCVACVNGTSYSDGAKECTDKCPSFSQSKETCHEAGFCKWNDKYRVCYAETQQSFTQIVVGENANLSAVVEVLEKEPGVIVIVDEERSVVLVYGDVDIEEAKRELGEFVVDSDTVVIEAAATEASDLEGPSGVSKGAFVAGVVVGGAAILGLGAAIVTMALNLKKPVSPIPL